MIALVEKIASGGVTTRQEARQAVAKPKAGRPKNYIFAYRPPTKQFNLKLSFTKTKVQKDEIITAAGQGGQVVADLALHEARELTVSGPLGPTRIEIADGRVRVAADPGPRQYCVRQGWLTHPGEIAVCAPNQVSVQVEGRTRRYDTLGY